ncbi:unnamed protein product [Acanthoscelides obtectus]|uniref:Uncharacterized protein n=1 Tax=Acanthoscelides obtectus TaxID=200917 RepID=A0A9P0MJU9_ACAOB|nr:unnamed protein product [Acanthoscelides obtectus]CAK1641208.1 hypothetical protein AOBTE_LOCUS12239 [Acanthoscelides obtectus]
MMLDNRKMIAIPSIERYRGNELAKILEFDVDICIYRRETRPKRDKADKTRPGSPEKARNAKRRIAKEREGVLVKSDGKSYVYLAKNLKAGVNLQNVEMEISKMRETRWELKGKAEDVSEAMDKQKRTRPKRDKADKTRPGSPEKARNAKRRIAKEREGVLVKSDGKSYVYLAKNLKAGVNLQNVEMEISKMRETRWELKGKAEDVSEAMDKQVSGAKTLKKTGLASTTNDDEVIGARNVALGEEEKDFRLSSLRPVYGESQKATIIASVAVADKLTRLGIIHKGLVHCRIHARSESSRCWKCWMHGHLPDKCKGADMSMLCLKCAQCQEERVVVIEEVSTGGRRISQKPEKNALKLREHQREYREARKLLRRLIETSKRNCWKRLLADVDNDVWGKGHQIVVKRLRLASLDRIPFDKRLEIIRTLFPPSPSLQVDSDSYRASIRFAMEELQEAATGLKDHKVSGPAEIIQLAVKAVPGIFLEVTNRALRTGVFPDFWKLAIMVLPKKKHKPNGIPSSYKNISLLDADGAYETDAYTQHSDQDLDSSSVLSPEAPQSATPSSRNKRTLNCTTWTQKKNKFLDASIKVLETPQHDVLEPQQITFGKNTGQQLQDIAVGQKIIAQKLISDVLYHAKLGNLTHSSHISLGYQPLSYQSTNISKLMLQVYNIH